MADPASRKAFAMRCLASLCLPAQRPTRMIGTAAARVFRCRLAVGLLTLSALLGSPADTWAQTDGVGRTANPLSSGQRGTVRPAADLRPFPDLRPVPNIGPGQAPAGNQPAALAPQIAANPGAGGQAAAGNNAGAQNDPRGLALPAGMDVNSLTAPQGLTASLKVMLLLTVLTLAPSILMMTTCFIRFVIVLGLLRQALGTQQLPPNQVLISLCLFLTVMVMAPVWQESYDQGIRPYTNPRPGEPVLDEQVAFQRAAAPVRRFLIEQIDRADNGDAVWMFLDFQRPTADSLAGRDYVEPTTYEDVPLTVLIPAYMLSELKVAFLIGFQIYLPFVVIDLVISALLISMGMMMMPPVLISLPLKLLLFVLIDGWFLTVGMLLESVRPLSG